jgi:hypothetical protein
MASDTTKRIAKNALEQIKAALLPLRDALRDQQPEFSVNGSTFKTPAALDFTVVNVQSWADSFQPTIGMKNGKAALTAAQQIESGDLDAAIETLGGITLTL